MDVKIKEKKSQIVTHRFVDCVLLFFERRKTGKEMLDYKRKQEEELTKRMLEERNREKAEDRAARERIKQQIALVSVVYF